MAHGEKTILWDFDGTLVPFTSWRFALMDVLNECEPGHGIDQEHIRPFLRDGFPWHHPQSYRLALSLAGNPEKVWMVGDNAVSDVKGAEDAGIHAILVRQPPTAGTKHWAADLKEVVRIIQADLS